MFGGVERDVVVDSLDRSLARPAGRLLSREPRSISVASIAPGRLPSARSGRSSCVVRSYLVHRRGRRACTHGTRRNATVGRDSRECDARRELVHAREKERFVDGARSRVPSRRPRVVIRKARKNPAPGTLLLYTPSFFLLLSSLSLLLTRNGKPVPTIARAGASLVFRGERENALNRGECRTRARAFRFSAFFSRLSRFRAFGVGARPDNKQWKRAKPACAARCFAHIYTCIYARV